MRLLEFFEILEAKDRITATAERYAKKIATRWDNHLNDAGMVGIPQEVRQAIDDGDLPVDAMTAERHKDWIKEKSEWVNQTALFFTKWFSQFDPTRNKAYTDWIIRQWLSGKILLEDAVRLSETLETFDEHKRKLKDIPEEDGVPPPQRRNDLNAWKDYRVLARAMRPLTGTTASGEKVTNFLQKPEVQSMMSWPVPDPVQVFGPEGDFDIEEIRSENHTGDGDFDTMDWYDWDIGGTDEATTAIKPLYKSDRLAVLQPNTQAAACELGRGTQWCTASEKSENYFWNYAPEGPLFVILTDKMGKYQWHFETGQFMNVHDEPLKPEELKTLVSSYPELRQVFKEQADKFGILWLMDPKKITPEYVQNSIDKMETATFGDDIEETLQKLPRAFDGEADEQALQMIEQWLRTNDPARAWELVRNPSMDDYMRSLQASAEDGRYNPAMKIYMDAKERGIALPDEVMRQLISRDGEAILYLSPEKMLEHPDWVVAALAGEPRLVENAVEWANGQSSWGDLADHSEEEQGKAMVHALQNEPKGINVVKYAVRHDPTLVIKMNHMFGTEPWKIAYGASTPGGRDRESLNNALSGAVWDRPLSLDYPDLMKYLLDHSLEDIKSVRAIEKAAGGFTLEQQKGILEYGVEFFDMLLHPDRDLLGVVRGHDQDNEPSPPRTTAQQQSVPPAQR